MWSTNREVKWTDIGQVPLLPLYGPRGNRSQPIKTHKRTRPVWINLERSSLVNKGFITWPKRKTVSYWTIAANHEQCRQDGQPIRTQNLLHLAPENIQILFCSHAFSRGLRQPHRLRCDWLKKQLAPLSQPIRGKQQRTVACFHVFCSAWDQLHAVFRHLLAFV